MNVLTSMSCFNNLIVKVERRTNTPSSPFQKVYERSLELPEGISVPYESLSCTLRFLYGSDCIVSFSSELVDYNKK